MRRKAMPTDARKFEGLLRNDFRAFIHKVFTTLCPGQDYERSWHVEAIAYRLERLRRGEIKRLIINMPPRSLKSIAASVAFPAFVLGLDPTHHLRLVFWRSRQEAFERLSRRARSALVPVSFSDRANRAIQELGNRDRADCAR